MKRGSRSPVGYYTMGIASLFIVGFFLLVVFGAQIYRDTSDSQNRNNEDRAVLAYLSSTIRAGDEKGAVEVTEGENGTMLVLYDAPGVTDYATRVYLYHGQLVEDYGRMGAGLSPAGAQKLGKTNTFDIEQTKDTLSISTDCGRVFIHLRSEGGES